MGAVKSICHWERFTPNYIMEVLIPKLYVLEKKKTVLFIIFADINEIEYW